MQRINKKIKDVVHQLYDIKDVYVITSESYWDGGYPIDATLSDKQEFYKYANNFSEIIRKIISTFGDKAFIGKNFSERLSLIAKWKDIKCYDSYNNLLYFFNKKYNYVLNSNDHDVIDFIVENDFRYFSFIDFYLPKFDFILQPTCHTEIIIYSNNYEKIIPTISEIVSDYKEIKVDDLSLT